MDFIEFSQQCAPTVAHDTMAAIVDVESSYNPYAIGIVDGKLEKQPTTKEEALSIALQLEKQRYNFSVGLAQINRYNLSKYHINYKDAFDPCINLQVGAKILEECYQRAALKFPQKNNALQAAFSCYYSGNFTRGFQTDDKEKTSYVQRILASANTSKKQKSQISNQENMLTADDPLIFKAEHNKTGSNVFTQEKNNLNTIVFY